jgi:hypothetical protein
VVDNFLLLLANTPPGVIVLAATNGLDGVDEAALRPGRLERAIFVGPPETAEGLAADSSLRFSTPMFGSAKDGNRTSNRALAVAQTR